MLRKLTSSTATGGGLTEPLTLSQQLTTSATGIAFQPAGPTLTNTGTTILASGPFTVGGLFTTSSAGVSYGAAGTVSNVGGVLTASGAVTVTGALTASAGLTVSSGALTTSTSGVTFGAAGPTLTNSGTTITTSGPLTATGQLTATGGVSFGTSGTITNAGANIIRVSNQLDSQYFNSVLATASFSNSTTQTSTLTPCIALHGFSSNQLNAWGVAIGLSTTWSGYNGQRLAMFGHSISNSGAGTYPMYIAGSGKLGFYNSASNATDVVGTATLVAGTKTVATGCIETGDLIFLTRNTPSGTIGNLSAPIASIVANTSFTINSDNASDTSTVNWWIIKKG